MPVEKATRVAGFTQSIAMWSGRMTSSGLYETVRFHGFLDMEKEAAVRNLSRLNGRKAADFCPIECLRPTAVMADQETDV